MFSETFSTQKVSVDDDNGTLCFRCSFAANSALYTSGCSIVLSQDESHILNFSIHVLDSKKCVKPLVIGWYHIAAFDILMDGIDYETPAVTSSYYVSVGITAATQSYSLNTGML